MILTKSYSNCKYTYPETQAGNFKESLRKCKSAGAAAPRRRNINRTT